MPVSDLRHFDRDALRRLLEQQQDNLAYLVQTATLSGGEEFAALELRNQLRAVRRDITELEAELARRAQDEAPGLASANLTPAMPGSAQLRRLLDAAFTADEFEIFCYDYYRSVYSQFVSTMSQTQRMQRLIQHVEGKPGLVKNLLDLVLNVNPAAYTAVMRP